MDEDIRPRFQPNNVWQEVSSIGKEFCYYNSISSITIWCDRKLDINENIYNCYENSIRKETFDNRIQAIAWLREKVILSNVDNKEKIITKIDNRFIEKATASTVAATVTATQLLKDLFSVKKDVAEFMNIFDIGYDAKSFRTEKGATKKLRDVLSNWLMTPKSKQDSVRSVQKQLKDDIVKYDRNGDANIKDWEIKRVAKTEIANAQILQKLLRWKAAGYTKVKHVTTVRPNSGKRDIQLNGRIFAIDHLLKTPDDRAPIHPNCNCSYVIYR